MKLLLVEATNFSSYPVGGQLSFLKEFIKHCDSQIKIYALGITMSENVKLGIWQKIRIANKEIYFMPVMRVRRNCKIPLSLSCLFYMFLFKYQIKKIKSDLIYIHRTGFDIPFWYWGIPIVMHIHGTAEYAARYSKFALIRHLSNIYTFMVRCSFKNASMILNINQEINQMYRQKFPKMVDKFLYMPNFIDMEVFKPLVDKSELRRKWGLNLDDKIIIYVGRLSKIKRIDLLIDSFALLAKKEGKAKLLIVGGGEEEKDLKEKVKRHKIGGKIIFFGEVPNCELPELINCSDIFALVSTTEGFSTTILECLACGIPGICTNVGVAGEVIKVGSSGILLNSNPSISEIALNMEKLLQFSSNKQLKSNCRNTVKEYSSEKIVAKICEYFIKMN